MKTSNVLIIGFGNIGQAHYKSFITKKNYKVFIYEKNLKLIEKLNKKNKYNFLSNLNSKKKFSIAIISANSDSRLFYLRKVLNKKIPWIILEKFLYTKKYHYVVARNLIKNYNSSIFVNSWGNEILIRSKLKTKKSIIKKIEFIVRKGEMLSNVTHFLDISSSLAGNYEIKNFKLKKFKLKISKRSGFNEIEGNINFKLGNTQVKIINKNSIRYHQLNIFTSNNKNIIKIFYDGSCQSFKNKKLINSFKFPYASKFSEKIFKIDSQNRNKIKYFNNYSTISKLEENFLININKKVKKLRIT
tara:strand:+ start:421 stop:1323 length:903 start_codon:yes stop_codon:yes gene_type:complete